MHHVHRCPKLIDMDQLRRVQPQHHDIAIKRGIVPRLHGVHFIEVKVDDAKPALLLRKAAAEHPQASATQLVLRAPHAFDSVGVGIRPAAQWLADLAA